MKIVVLDGYTENPGDLSWNALKELGEVTVYDRTSYEESPLIAERIGDAEIVVMNKTPISKETIDKCGNIKLIAVLATGYNVVDYTYAKEKGIPVVNVPTYGTQIVGQYALGLLLEICSHYGHHDETVKAGKWENNEDLVLLGLSHDRTVWKDSRHYRPWKDRTGNCQTAEGPGYEGTGI